MSDLTTELPQEDSIDDQLEKRRNGWGFPRKRIEPIVGGAIRGKAACVVGLLVLAIAGGFCYVAWGELPTGTKRPTVSPELFTGIAVGIFGMPGLYMLVRGLIDNWYLAQARRGEAFYPDEPWLWDYRWNSLSTGDIQWRQHFKAVTGLLLGICIMVPFHWLVIEEELPWFVLAGLILFDICMLLAAGTIVARIARELAHGRSRVSYTHFPLRLGEMVKLQLEAANRLDDLQSLRYTLFCIQEECITRKHGSSNVTECVARPLYEVQQELDKNSLFSLAGGTLPLEFELPDSPDLATQLSAKMPRYWLLQVEGKRSGLDYEKRFLLPIYA